MAWFIVLSVFFTAFLVLRKRVNEWLFMRNMAKRQAHRKAYIHGAKQFTASYKDGTYNV